MKKLATALIISCLTITGAGLSTNVLADHGKGMGMMHHGGHGSSWKASLTDEQRTKIAKLKLDYKKKKYPLKAKLKQAKIDLALLVTSDKPNQNSIDKKIDQIAKLKREKMQLKAKHKIAVRKLLNEEQRVKFDMKVLKKAYHGKRKGGYGHHGRHH